FEFGSDVAVCFPEGPERDRRSRAAENRMRRYLELERALRNDPEGVPAEVIDAVIALYETGFRKLGAAQRRDRCVFEPALGPEASSFDGYAEGLRAEYLFARIKLREFARKQPQGTPQAAPDDLARAVGDTCDYYRTLLGLDGVPYAQRLEKIATLKIPKGDDT